MCMRLMTGQLGTGQYFTKTQLSGLLMGRLYPWPSPSYHLHLEELLVTPLRRSIRATRLGNFSSIFTVLVLRSFGTSSPRNIGCTFASLFLVFVSYSDIL